MMLKKRGVVNREQGKWESEIKEWEKGFKLQLFIVRNQNEAHFNTK